MPITVSDTLTEQCRLRLRFLVPPYAPCRCRFSRCRCLYDFDAAAFIFSRRHAADATQPHAITPLPSIVAIRHAMISHCSMPPPLAAAAIYTITMPPCHYLRLMPICLPCRCRHDAAMIFIARLFIDTPSLRFICRSSAPCAACVRCAPSRARVTRVWRALRARRIAMMRSKCRC